MRKYFACFLALFCFVLLCDPVKAMAEQNATNLISGLSYEILYPENQKNKQLGYFDLTMQAGQQQKVFIKLYNSSLKELTVQIRLNTAKTNSIGKVEYGPNVLKEDASLTNDFINIVKGPKKVVIPAKGNKQAELTISLQKNSFEGLIAGGIQLQPIDNKKEKKQGKKDIVVNEFAFLVGMLLRVGDSSMIKPELKLNKTYIAFKENRSHLFVNISNIQPIYVEGMNVAIQVRKDNKQKILFEHQKKGLRMAPNSMIDLPIELADKGMSAGKYTAQIKVSSKNGGNWSWTDDFTINTLEANSLNSQLVEKQGNIKLIFWLVLPILGISTLIFSLSYRRKKQKKAKK